MPAYVATGRPVIPIAQSPPRQLRAHVQSHMNPECHTSPGAQQAPEQSFPPLAEPKFARLAHLNLPHQHLWLAKLVQIDPVSVHAFLKKRMSLFRH